MPDAPEFPEYATTYSKEARPLRDALSASLRRTLDEIEDMLAENPDRYPHRTRSLSADIFIYQHAQPCMEVTYKIDRESKIIRFVHIVVPKLEVTTLFISYSHEDEKWLLELKKFLKPLEEDDRIRIWDDRELKAGDDWQDKIKKALSSARAAVLLISQNFLNSDFIVKHELPALLDSAKDKGLKILWIAVSSSTVDDTAISKYQAVLKEPPLDILRPAERKKAFVRIYKEIKKVVKIRDPL
ncbi:MAG: toll/interleukin-1 receptor domain-containing protein [Desulfobacteraceae bacterium]|nr:toll/interleukin-1 receptor domain-containing protein [Desulfobacteraceae bacterium]